MGCAHTGPKALSSYGSGLHGLDLGLTRAGPRVLLGPDRGLHGPLDRSGQEREFTDELESLRETAQSSKLQSLLLQRWDRLDVITLCGSRWGGGPAVAKRREASTAVEDAADVMGKRQYWWTKRRRRFAGPVFRPGRQSSSSSV